MNRAPKLITGRIYAPDGTATDFDDNIIGNNRTAALVVNDITEHIEAAWVSRVLSQPIGTANFAPSRFGNNFAGKTVDSFSTAKSNDIRRHNGNMYVNDAGINFIDQSFVLQDFETNLKPTLKDVIQRDWLIANLRAATRTFFGTASDTPYTDESINLLADQWRTVLNLAGNRGIIPLATTPSQIAASDSSYRYSIDTPTRAEVETNSPLDIEQRVLKNVRIAFTEAKSFGIVQVDVVFF